MKVVTEEEYEAGRAQARQKKDPSKAWKELGFWLLQDYHIIYDEPDAGGFWGRRLTKIYHAKGKEAHESVRSRFLELHPNAQIFRIVQD